MHIVGRPPLEPSRRDGHRPLPARAPPPDVDDLLAWAADAGPAGARHRQPARLGRRWRATRCRARACCCSARSPSGCPTPPGPARRRRPAHRPVRLDPLDQRGRRGRDRHARLDRPARRTAGLSRGRTSRASALRRRARLGAIPPPLYAQEMLQMAIATPEVYAEMIDRAKAGKFAYPAVNITSSQTITAALQGFAEAESDGIIQVSVGGAEYAAGSTVKDRIAGSLALAAYAAEVAKGYPVTVALHTDHCAKQNLDSWVRPLLALEAEQVKAGKLPDVPVAHVRRLGRAARREPRHRRGAARAVAGRPHDPRDRGRRRRWRGGRPRGRDQRQAVHDRRGRPGHGQGARRGREGPLPDGPDVRQRARRLQARRGQAAPVDPRGDPEGRRRRASARRTRSTWSSTAAPARPRPRSPRPSTTASSR